MPRAKKVAMFEADYAAIEQAGVPWNNFDVYDLFKDDLPPIMAPVMPPAMPEVEKPRAKKRVEDNKDLGHLGKAVALFRQELGSMPSRWCIGHAAGYKEWPAEICHAALKELPKSLTLFASNCDVPKDMHDAGEAWWSFMTGDQSPWRPLFEHGKPEPLFYEDGRRSGFVLNNIDAVDKKKTTLIYNFCIAMRMIHEYDETIRAWYYFVSQKGLDGIEALYLSRMYQPVKKAPGMVARTGTNDGCHWPLWFSGAESYSNYGYKNINFDRLYNADPTFHGRSCNQWCDTCPRKSLSDFVTKIKEVVVSKGVFSKVKGIPEDELIVEYRDWMKNYRIEFNKKLEEKK